MVVVDNARRMIGKTIATQVTSVLQTTAGKMIFGRFPEESEAAAAAQQNRQDRRPYDKPIVPPNRVNNARKTRNVSRKIGDRLRSFQMAAKVLTPDCHPEFGKT